MVGLTVTHTAGHEARTRRTRVCSHTQMRGAWLFVTRSTQVVLESVLATGRELSPQSFSTLGLFRRSTSTAAVAEAPHATAPADSRAAASCRAASAAAA